MGPGELATRAGCHLETIRYYEREGLIPDPPRTSGGHRLYSLDHLRRLRFIVRSRELGFRIKEIRAMLTLVDHNDQTCHEIHEIASMHLGHIKEKIRDLRRLQKVLTQLVDQCSDDNVPECPILDALYFDGRA